MKKHIVFITDCVDIAYNELRAITISELNKLNPEDEIVIEPVVKVKPFSVINGSFVLRLMAESYPDNTIFSIILNPLQSRPERLIGKTTKKNFSFAGANTGLFNWFLNDFGISELYELKDPGFLPFGGKYVHAPAVAKIASGVPLEELGTIFNRNKLRDLNLETGTVVHVDNFGLIKFTGILPQLEDEEKVEILVNDQKLDVVYSTRMMNRETGEWVIYPGSSMGLPELGKVRQNGAMSLKIKEGDIIKFI